MNTNDRRCLLLFKRDLRREMWAWSRACYVPFKALIKLDELYRQEQEKLAIIFELLKQKKFKSTFRERVALQARDWCMDHAETMRMYPLTHLQIVRCKTPGTLKVMKALPRTVAQLRHQKRVCYATV